MDIHKADADFEAELEAELSRKFGEMAGQALTQEALNMLSGGNIEGFLTVLDWAGFVQDTAEIARILATAGQATGIPTITIIRERAQERARQMAPELFIGSAPHAFPTGSLGMPPSGVIDLAFDVVDMNVVSYAERRAALLVVQVSDEMRNTIRGQIVASLRGGMTPQQTAREIARYIPLHSRFANAVVRRHRTLLAGGIKDGMTLNAAMARANRMSDAYARKLTRLRARTIARTEIMSASNYGQLEGYRSAIEAGLMTNPNTGKLMVTKEWITAEDERVCPQCGPLNLLQVDWSERFPGGMIIPPAHPNCRCSFNIIDHADQWDYDGAGTAEQEYAGVVA